MDILFLSALNSDCDKCQKECINAIHTLGKRAAAFTKLPTIENGVKPGLFAATGNKIFLGEEYLNNPKMSDVVFEVDDEEEAGAPQLDGGKIVGDGNRVAPGSSASAMERRI